MYNQKELRNLRKIRRGKAIVKGSVMQPEKYPEGIKAFQKAGWMVQDYSGKESYRRAMEEDWGRAAKYIFKVFMPDSSVERGYKDGGYIIYHKDGTINYELERSAQDGKRTIRSKYCAKIDKAEDYEKAKLIGPFYWLTTDRYIKP